MNRSANTFRARLRIGGLVAALALLGALTFGPSALSGPNTRLFSAAFTSSAPGGENSQPMSLVIQNLGSNQLGSADVTAAPGFQIVNVSGLNATSSFDQTSIHLRDLNLASGAFLTFPMTVNVPCPAKDYSWGITGFKNNDGTGQTFALDPSSITTTSVTLACTLSIMVQPNHSAVNTPIRDVAYGFPTTGNPVKVVAKNNDPAAPLALTADEVTLGQVAGLPTSPGTGFKNNKVDLAGAGAEAIFTTLQSDRTGLAFKLQATAAGYISSGASSSFDVEFAGCKGPTCNPSTPPVGPHTHTQASVTGSVLAGGDSLGVGLIKYSQFNFPPGFCSVGDFVPLADSDGFTTSVQVDSSGGQRDYTVTAILDKFIMNQIPQNGADAVLTCFFGNRIDPDTGLPRTCTEDIADELAGFPTVNDPNGDLSFRAKCDNQRGADSTDSWGGILPKAGPGINSCTDAALKNPVVLSQNKSGGPPGSLVIKICKPWPTTVTTTDLPWDGGGGWR